MARALAVVLLLAGLTGGSCHGSAAREAEVANRTEAALQAQADFRHKVQAAVANETAVAAVEQELEKVPGEAEAQFRARRDALQKSFEEQQRAAERAAEEAARANGTEAVQASLNESDAALATLRNVSDSLDDLDSEQLRAVKGGLRAACEPTVRRAKETRRRADRLEHTSHRVLDPLYSMGDRAEDRADGFNDRAVDAKDATVDAVDGLARRVKDRARDVQERAQEALAAAARTRHRSVEDAAVQAGRAAQRLAAMEAVAQQLAEAPRSSAAPASTMGMAAGSALLGAVAAALALGARPWRKASGGLRPLLA